MSPEPVEILILGSGQGCKLLAWHMAQSGRRAAVDREQLDESGQLGRYPPFGSSQGVCREAAAHFLTDR